MAHQGPLRVRVDPSARELAPGDVLTISVEVLNTGTVIDSFSVTVLGLDQRNVQASPAALSLFPDARDTIEVEIALPRNLPAGINRFGVKVWSTTDPSTYWVEEVEIALERVGEAAMFLEPQQVTGGRKGRMIVTVENSGNAALDLELTARDAEHHLDFVFDPPAILVPPRSSTSALMHMRGSRPFFGGREPRPLTVIATGAPEPIQGNGVFVQRPWIARGLLTLGGIGLIMALWGLVLIAGVDRIIDDTEADQGELNAKLASQIQAFQDAQEEERARQAEALAALPGSLSGTVTAQSNAALLEGVTVEAFVECLFTGEAPPTGEEFGEFGGLPEACEPPQVPEGEEASVAGIAVTGPDGLYVLTGLEPGLYTLRAKAVGFREAVVPGALVSRDEATTTNIEMLGNTGSISGVIGDDTGPLPFVTMVVSGPGLEETSMGLATDEDGVTTMTELQIVPCELDLEVPTPEGGVFTVAVDEETAQQCEDLIGEEGRTVSPYLFTISFANGEFTLGRLQTPGQFTITFKAPGYGNQTTTVALRAGENKEAVAVTAVSGAGSISGTISDTEGNTLGGVQVRAVSGDTVIETLSLTEGGNIGFYSLSAVPTPGEYTITYSLAGFIPQTISVPIEAGENLEEASGSAVDVVLEPDPTSTGSISGTVFDTANIPLAGINVVADGQTISVNAVTGPDGSYLIEGLVTPDSYSVTFSGAGFVTKAVSVELDAGGIRDNVDVNLEASSGGIAGIVLGDGVPLGGAQVLVTGGPGGGAVTNTLTEGDVGGYSFTGLKTPGDYALTFSAEGFITQVVEVSLEPGGNVVLDDVDLEIDEELLVYTIEGVVSDAVTGDPLGEAVATLAGGDIALAVESLTDDPGPVGRYFFTKVPVGEYALTVMREGYLPATIDVIVPGPDGDIDLDVELDPDLSNAGRIEGSVEAPAGTPLGGAEVVVTSASGTGAGTITLTEDSTAEVGLGVGDYVLTGLGPDDYIMTVSKDGFIPQIFAIRLDLGETRVLPAVVLEPDEGTIAGTAFDAAAVPLPGVEVSLSRDSQVEATEVTGPAGTYTFTGIASGTYAVTFSKIGHVTQVVQVTLLPGEGLAGVDATLPLNAGTIGGSVTHAVTTLPLNGVKVSVARDGAVQGSTLTPSPTLPAGDYLVGGLASATYEVTFEKPGFVPVTRQVALPPGAGLDLDVAMRPEAGSISGTVYITTIGGTPLGGATVKLARAGQVDATVVSTAAVPGYLITGLTPGTYALSVERPGYIPAIRQVTLGPQDGLTAIDVALVPVAGSVTGTVRDTASAPIVRAMVTASRNGAVQATALTDPAGLYTLTGLSPGEYTITFAKSGYVAQSRQIGLANVALTPVDATLTVDTGSVSGTVTDAATTLRLPRVGVTAVREGRVAASTFTDASDCAAVTPVTCGTYSFTGLAPGLYEITFARAGYVRHSRQVNLPAGDSRTGVDAALTPEGTDLAGTAFAAPGGGGTELGNVTVTVTRNGQVEATTVTADPAGTYLLADLQPGPYSVTFAKLGFRPVVRQVDLEAAVDVAMFDAVLDPDGVTVSGTVSAPGPVGLSGVKVTLSRNGAALASTVSGPAGAYTLPEPVAGALPGFPPGTYSVTFEKYGWIAEVHTVHLVTGEDVTLDVTLEAAGSSLSGTVFAVPGGAGTELGNVTVTATRYGGDEAVTVTATPGGTYAFTGLAPGVYSVEFAKAGFVAQTRQVTLPAAEAITGFDATLTPAAGSVSGTVFESPGGAGFELGNVTVTATRAGSDTVIAVTATPGGTYTLIGLAPGVYSVEFAKPGYVTQARQVTVPATEGITGFDATLAPAAGSISGTVYASPGGAGFELGDVTITVAQGGQTQATATTAAGTGAYAVSGLVPGTYAVTFSKPGYISQTTQVVLPAGEAVTGVDATLSLEAAVLAGGISGTVFESPGGAGFELAAVTVTVAQSGQVQATAVTSGTGTYSVTGLAPGTYTVIFEKDGYLTQSKQVAVAAGVTTAGVDATLDPATGTISGTVFESPGGAGFELGSVEITAHGPGETQETVSATDPGGSIGAYEFTGLDPGTWTVTFVIAGYRAESHEVTVTAGATSALSPVLDPLGGITGTTYETAALAGNEIGAVAITATFGDRTVTTSSLTTAGSVGDYDLLDLEPGTWTVTFEKVGYEPESHQVLVGFGPTTQDAVLISTMGSIEGNVEDSVTAAKLGGVTVTATGPGGTRATTTLTDPAADLGDYLLPELDAGSWTITFSKTGYVSETYLVTVVAGATTMAPLPQPVDLDPLYGTVSGTVFESPGGAGTELGGVTITATSGPQTIVSTSVSTPAGDLGDYEFTGLEPGTWTITFSKPGYQSETVQTTIAAGATFTPAPAIVLTRSNGTVSGTVTSSVAPFPAVGDVTVSASGPGGATATTGTSATGTYSLDLDPGIWTLTFAKDGYAPSSASVTIVAGASPVVSPSITPYGAISGLVCDDPDPPCAMPLDDVTVTARKGSLVRTTVTLTSGGGGPGTYLLVDLEPGTWAVTYSKTGFTSKTFNVTVAAGATTAAPSVEL